ncbi:MULTISPECIES: GntR family transcriptional regulator [unclassified Micromonospora]|uniref:GntR family transcriptional regulator n=1 Tax=unclassified Micromonospora TaxID=2617518 RepID=UPI00333497FD
MPTPHYGQPRYRTIANELRRRIESGAIPPGVLLPAESALTAEFKASRGTVRQAMAILRDEGLLVTAHGRGTYVSPQASQSVDSTVTNTWHEREVDEELAAVLDVPEGTRLRTRREIRRSGSRVESVVDYYDVS